MLCSSNWKTLLAAKSKEQDVTGKKGKKGKKGTKRTRDDSSAPTKGGKQAKLQLPGKSKKKMKNKKAGKSTTPPQTSKEPVTKKIQEKPQKKTTIQQSNTSTHKPARKDDCFARATLAAKSRRAAEKEASVEEPEADKKAGMGPTGNQTGPSSCMAMDCEMVGTGPEGKDSVLARCSIVNFTGHVVYDKYVRTTVKVTDYRTHVSGIRPAMLVGPNAITFKQCQAEVEKLLENRVLIGHSIDHDLKSLKMKHPWHLTRDTAFYKALCPHRPKALKKLLLEKLEIEIQTGEHSSVEDARSVLALYKTCRKEWEKEVAQKARAKRNAKFGKKKLPNGYPAEILDDESDYI